MIKESPLDTMNIQPAASGGYQVGYDDASHCNREYKWLFGLPPMRNVERLREVVAHHHSLGADE